MDEENKYVMGLEPDREEVLRRFGALDKKFHQDRLRGRVGLVKYALLQAKRALTRRRTALA